MPQKPDPTALRYEYQKASLSESDILKDPFLQFEKWFNEAIQAQVDAPEAMALSTVDREGHPDSRMVLLKQFDKAGFVFFTNFQSTKGQELKDNPHAALLFWWPELERQIRITGPVTPVAETEADTYFATRPRGAQIGANASPQSQVISGRDFLESRIRDLENQFTNQPVPRPKHWSGFRVKPHRFEFWQGRESRLHDRIRFLQNNNRWTIERLAP